MSLTEGDSRRAVSPLGREELAHLLATAQTHAIERKGTVVHPYRAHYPFLLLLARTGLRLGEAMALKWGDPRRGGLPRRFTGKHPQARRKYGRRRPGGRKRNPATYSDCGAFEKAGDRGRTGDLMLGKHTL